MTNRTSRLAPSPTGALHLGNARTFLINWALARQEGWRLLMRIEDLDGPRVKPESTCQTLDILAWLGLDWDGDPTVQSTDLDPYRDAMRQLSRRRLVFPCDLSRKEIEQAASAPHTGEHELRFPPGLRPTHIGENEFTDEARSYRFLVPDEVIRIDDAFSGPVEFNPHFEVGDFVIWTKRGVPAYQLAVVVDDARQGVTEIVRGEDLLASAARQGLLYRALELEAPRYCHLPLVLGPDGRRLAKRHGDTRLITYREAGVAPQRIIGLLAFWCGLAEQPEEMTATDFRDRFELATLSGDPVIFSETDHAWLLGRHSSS